MSNTEQKNVLITITEKYDEIFKAEKKVADFILKNPEVAVNANVSELANYSGVSYPALQASWLFRVLSDEDLPFTGYGKP